MAKIGVRRRKPVARRRSEQLSVRIDPETLARLEERARGTRRSRSALVQRYVEEGLRMDEHPGIIFTEGPAGRRPSLRRRPGLDVWEIIQTVRASRSAKGAAGHLNLTPGDIDVALAYYARHRDEIDDWIRGNEELAERMEAEWRKRRELMK